MATADWSGVDLAGSSFSRESFTDLWLAALAAYGVGDVVTTVAVVWFSPRYVEANPVVAAATGAFGVGGLIALKLSSFYAVLGISLWGIDDDDPLLFYGPPLLLAVVGSLVTVANLVTLL